MTKIGNNFTTFHNFHQINELSFPLNTKSKKDIANNIYETLPKSQEDEKKLLFAEMGKKDSSTSYIVVSDLGL